MSKFIYVLDESFTEHVINTSYIVRVTKQEPVGCAVLHLARDIEVGGKLTRTLKTLYQFGVVLEAIDPLLCDKKGV